MRVERGAKGNWWRKANLFLTELSERPGRALAISAHRVPSLACISRMIWSSCPKIGEEESVEKGK